MCHLKIIWEEKVKIKVLVQTKAQKDLLPELQQEVQTTKFAGKLNFINWGYGTNCQSGVILNSETGEIYDGIVTAWGFKSKPNSRLLIAEYKLFENKENDWLPFCSYYILDY